MPAKVGAAAPTADPDRILVALADRLAIVDVRSGELEPLARHPARLPRPARQRRRASTPPGASGSGRWPTTSRPGKGALYRLDGRRRSPPCSSRSTSPTGSTGRGRAHVLRRHADPARRPARLRRGHRRGREPPPVRDDRRDRRHRPTGSCSTTRAGSGSRCGAAGRSAATRPTACVDAQLAVPADNVTACWFARRAACSSPPPPRPSRWAAACSSPSPACQARLRGHSPDHDHRRGRPRHPLPHLAGPPRLRRDDARPRLLGRLRHAHHRRRRSRATASRSPRAAATSCASPPSRRSRPRVHGPRPRRGPRRPRRVLPPRHRRPAAALARARRRASSTSPPPRSSTRSGTCGRAPRASRCGSSSPTSRPSEFVAPSSTSSYLTDAIDPGTRPRAARGARRRQGRAPRRDGARRLPRLHDLGRLARLHRGRDPPARPRGGRRGLERREDEGRRAARGRRPPRRDHPRGDRHGAAADDGRQPGLGRPRGDREDARA